MTSSQRLAPRRAGTVLVARFVCAVLQVASASPRRQSPAVPPVRSECHRGPRNRSPPPARIGDRRARRDGRCKSRSDGLTRSIRNHRRRLRCRQGRRGRQGARGRRASTSSSAPCPRQRWPRPKFTPQRTSFIATETRHPDLTLKRAGPSIFRLAGSDDAQGLDAARICSRLAGDKTIAIVHDRTLFAKTIAERPSRH